MRAAALLAGAAGALLCAHAAHALEAGDVSWGCEDAGYARPVEPAGQGVAHRAMVLLVHTDWGVLPATLELPEAQAYTGGAPVCADLDGDGAAEVVAAIAGPEGGWLTVYGKRTGPIVSTGPVAGGVALLGVADLDGDGRAELAWIEDAAGAGRLSVAGLRDGALVEIASAEGFARGPDIGMAVETCGAGGAWLVVQRSDGAPVRVRLAEGALTAEPLDEEATAVETTCAAARHEETQ